MRASIVILLFFITAYTSANSNHDFQLAKRGNKNNQDKKKDEATDGDDSNNSAKSGNKKSQENKKDEATDDDDSKNPTTTATTTTTTTTTQAPTPPPTTTTPAPSTTPAPLPGATCSLADSTSVGCYMCQEMQCIGGIVILNGCETGNSCKTGGVGCTDGMCI